MATVEPTPINIFIQRITISQYVDASHSGTGYNPIPTLMDVTFTVGVVDDTITIKYMNPLNLNPIREEIKRILSL